MSLFKIILNTLPRPLLIKASYLVNPIIRFYLKGDCFTDPIDGKSFRKFLPYGYGKQREKCTFSLYLVFGKTSINVAVFKR